MGAAKICRNSVKKNTIKPFVSGDYNNNGPTMSFTVS